jgi:hypothetical protein
MYLNSGLFCTVINLKWNPKTWVKESFAVSVLCLSSSFISDFLFGENVV